MEAYLTVKIVRYVRRRGSGTSSHTNGGLQYNQLLQRKLIRLPTMNKKKGSGLTTFLS